MYNKAGGEVLLNKTANGWTVNGKYAVMKGTIETLLKTLDRMVVSYPVPKEQLTPAIEDLSVNGVKTMVYNGNGELIRSFYVGSPTNDHLGTYMILENDGKMADQPFVVELKGFEGFLTTRFFVEEEKWRDRKILDLTKEEINTVTVNYPAAPDHSYHIFVYDKDSITVAFPSEPDNHSRPINKERVIQYLEFFTEVYAEAFANDDLRKDSILATEPFCTIRVAPHVGNTTSIELFYMPMGQRSKKQFDSEGNPMTHDVDRFYASVNGLDFMVVQDYTFRKLMVSHLDFIANQESQVE